MIGAYIGKAIGEPIDRTALQTITANVDTSVGIVRSVGFFVATQVDLAISVIKSVGYTVTAAAVDLASSAVKSAGKIVPVASITAAVGSITKSVGKIVTAPVDLSVAVSRAISFSITVALLSISAVISTFRRHPGKPLLFRNSGGRRGFWRGSR